MSSSNGEHGLPRRGFLVRMASAALPVSVMSFGMGRRLSAQTSPPDESWLRSLTGTHKMVFDVEAHRNGHALAQAKGFLDAYEEAYDVPRSEVNLVLGVRGTGLPLVLGDALWARYRIGEQYAVGGKADATASHNPFTSAHVRPSGPLTAEQTVDALQRRGVLFLVCNNTIGGAARKLAAAGFGTVEAIRTELLAGLHPGVVIVPAMVVAFNRMQERGVSYVYAG